MQRTLVIRTYGNQELAMPIANALQPNYPQIDRVELERLRAELGVHRSSDHKRNINRIKEAELKYHVEPVTGIKAKLLGLVGLVLLLKGDSNE